MAGAGALRAALPAAHSKPYSTTCPSACAADAAAAALTAAWLAGPLCLQPLCTALLRRAPRSLVPCQQGPFDVAIFNAVFGNLLDPHDALVRACFLLRPGR